MRVPLRVLVTRPREQSEPFVQGCLALGLTPVALPCLEIEALAPPDATPLPSSGTAIFTSRNAVVHGLALQGWPAPAVTVLAVGPATARALAATGIAVAHEPAPPYTSEALLDTLARLSRVQLDGGITLVTGEGGRRWLVQALQQHGHHVTVLEVYRRRAAQPLRATLQAALTPLPDIVTSTSDASLDALLDLAGSIGCEEALRQRPLLVNGARAAQHARQRGFGSDIRVPAQAGDVGQLNVLAGFLRDCNSRGTV